MQNTKKLVIAALFTALTCATTMIIKIPTPTMGYIHPGDGMVLLCGMLLGPGIGALAAGIGSMLADLLSGYVSYSIGTLFIKAFVAASAGFLYYKIRKSNVLCIIACGLAGECFMVVGYFLYELGMAVVSGSGLAAAATAAGAGVIMNIIQGFSGVLISIILLPILRKIPTFYEWSTRIAE